MFTTPPRPKRALGDSGLDGDGSAQLEPSRKRRPGRWTTGGRAWNGRLGLGAWIWRPGLAPPGVRQLALDVAPRVACLDLAPAIVLLLALAQPELQLRLAASRDV